MEIMFAKNGPSLSDPPLSSLQCKGTPRHKPTPNNFERAPGFPLFRERAYLIGDYRNHTYAGAISR